MNQPGTHTEAYIQARNTAAWLALPQAGCLQISGADRIAFLQRQTTNELRTLSAGQAIVSVLTSATARMLDVLTIFMDGESLTVLTLPGYGAGTFKFLKSRIFFMDKVSLLDRSAEFAQVLLVGAQAGEVLTKLGLPVPPKALAITTGKLGEHAVQVLAEDWAGLPAVRLALPAGALDALGVQLVQAGANPLGAEVFEVLRVEAGIPWAGAELSENYTPLETNLDRYISGSKGCYTGQEVLARQVTYDKITRRLVGVRSATPLKTGMRLLAEDKPAGEITSAVQSPQLGWIGLAIVKRPYHEPGTHLAQAENDSTIQVTSLPFSG